MRLSKAATVRLWKPCFSGSFKVKFIGRSIKVNGGKVKQFALVFARGIGLGLGIGLCLAGAVAIFYRATHAPGPQGTATAVLVYLLVVGGLMGMLGGWALALQMVFSNALASLFMKIAELVPVPATEVGEGWAGKMETFFREVLQPMPPFFRKFVNFFMVARFHEYGRINRAIDKAKRRGGQPSYSSEWMSRVALHYFMEPLWILFYIVYAVLFLI